MNATHALDTATDNMLTLLLHAGHLTVAEAAAATGLSQFAIRDAINRGDLPARQAYVISVEDLRNL
jgi:hypothetical protein